MSLSKSMILVASVLLSTSIPTLAKPSSNNHDQKEIYCRDTYPERSGICTFIYSPVCASYPQACFTTPCPQVQEYSNACVACSDHIVESYTPGPCEEEQETLDQNELKSAVPLEQDNGTVEEEQATEDAQKELVCSDTYPERSGRCTREYNPVCVTECTDGPCRFTAATGCTACANANVLTYLPGSCEEKKVELDQNELKSSVPLEQDNDTVEEKQPTEGVQKELFCSDTYPERSGRCTREYNPVCVTECKDGPCRFTAATDCTACANANVLTYLPGSCEEKKVECPVVDLSATDIACIDLWDPVCAYSESWGAAGVTVSNTCYACSIHGADSYIAGECPENPANDSEDNQEGY